MQSQIACSLKPGQLVLVQPPGEGPPERRRVREVAYTDKDHVKVRFVSRPPLYCVWDTALAVEAPQ